MNLIKIVPSVLVLMAASVTAAGAFPATATTDLNVRSGPGTGYGIVGQLQAGQTVDVVSQNGSWYQLADGGECCVTVHPSSLMRTAPPS